MEIGGTRGRSEDEPDFGSAAGRIMITLTGNVRIHKSTKAENNERLTSLNPPLHL